MQRVLVIGSSGAGKSTFARHLGEATGLPVIHLDSVYWKAGWVESDKEEWRDKVAEIVTGDRWVIDGNYSGTLEMRLAACDTVIFLDLSRFVCMWRIFKRGLTYRGRTRPDMAAGCDEKMPDLEFIKWTWQYPTRSRPKVLRRLAKVEERVWVVRITSQNQAQAFLRSLRGTAVPKTR